MQKCRKDAKMSKGCKNVASMQNVARKLKCLKGKRNCLDSSKQQSLKTKIENLVQRSTSISLRLLLMKTVVLFCVATIRRRLNELFYLSHALWLFDERMASIKEARRGGGTSRSDGRYSVFTTLVSAIPSPERSGEQAASLFCHLNHRDEMATATALGLKLSRLATNKKKDGSRYCHSESANKLFKHKYITNNVAKKCRSNLKCSYCMSTSGLLLIDASLYGVRATR